MDIAHHKTHSFPDSRPVFAAFLAIVLAVASIIALTHGLHELDHSAGAPSATPVCSAPWPLAMWLQLSPFFFGLFCRFPSFSG
jgi:hypothetical protein